MKKLSILKRSLCVFIASLMMISYSSCSKNGDKNSSGGSISSVHQIREGHKIENYFTSSALGVPGGLTYVKDIKCTEDRIIYSGFCDNDTENAVVYYYDPVSGKKIKIDTGKKGISEIRNVYLSESGIYLYGKDSSDASVLYRTDTESGEIAASTSVENNEFISSVYTDENGDLAILTYGNNASDSTLRTYDPASLELKSAESLSSRLSLDEGEYICFIVPDNDRFLMFSQTADQDFVNLYICDSELNVSEKYEKVSGKMKGIFSGAFRSADGKIGVITCDHSQMLAVYSVGLFDTGSGELTGIYDPKLEKGSFVLPHTDIEGYDYVYSDGTSLYGCNASEQKSEKIIDFSSEISQELSNCFAVSVSDGCYLLHSASYDDEGGLINIVTDTDGKVLYSIDIKTGSDSNLTGITVLEGNSAAVSEIVYSETESNEYAQMCRVHIIDDSGKEKSSFEVSGKESEKEHEGGFGDINYGKNGNIYLPYNLSNDGNGNPAGRLYVYDINGNRKYMIGGEDILYIDRVITGKENDYFVYTDSNGISHTAVIDDAENKAGADIKFKADDEKILYITDGTEEYDFCYCTSDGVFGYNAADSVSSEIVNWIDSDIGFEVQKICITGPDRILCYVWDYSIAENALYALDRADEKLLSEIQNKEIITVAGTGLSNSIIYDAILYFNKNSSGFRIQLEDYEKYSEYTDEGYVSGEDKLNKDIESGNIPDIIIGNKSVNMTSFASAGLFTDLNSFFDADKDTDRSLLIGNILDIFSQDGKQYQLPVGFGIRTIAGKASVLGEESGWTTGKFLEAAGRNDMFFKPGRSEMRTVLITENLSEYIDFAADECSFDSPEFIQLLEYIKENGLSDEEFAVAAEEMTNANDGNEKYYEYLKRFTQDKCQAEILEFSDFYEPASFENNLLGEKAVFKGIPSSAGNGCLVVPDVVAAIAADSAKKNAAWGFLRGLLIDSFQAGLITSYPINMDVFDYYMSSARSNESASSYANSDGEYVSSGLLSEDAAKAVIAAVADASRAVTSDTHITEIINEETDKLFNGEQTAEDSAKNIQKRVSEYLKKL